MAWIDMGAFLYDDEGKTTIEYDENGNPTGYIWCPYIDKEAFNPYVRVYDKDNPDGKLVLKADLMKSYEKS